MSERLQQSSRRPSANTLAQEVPSGHSAKLSVRSLSVYYGDRMALDAVDLDMNGNEVTALIGPSGCGKSTLLRCLNRLSDTIPDCRVSGSIKLNGLDIYAASMDVVQLRARVGMVFQTPNPFPRSVYDNIAYGPRLHGLADSRADLDEIVIRTLEMAGLWADVQDRLDESALSLSSGQQQRLCIARALALSPEALLMDEPCSALDPVATARIESLIEALKTTYAIVIVTHSMQQAARISEKTAFLKGGRVVEYGPTDTIFTTPHNPLTRDYITGRFG